MEGDYMKRFPFSYAYSFSWWSPDAIADDGEMGDIVTMTGTADLPFTLEEILIMSRNTGKNPQFIVLESMEVRVKEEAKGYNDLEDFSMKWHFVGSYKQLEELELYV